MRIAINTAGIAPGWGGAEETFLRHLLRELSKFDASTDVVVLTDEDNDTSFHGVATHRVNKPAEVERAAAGAGADVLFTSIERLHGAPKIPVLPYATQVRHLESTTGVRKFLGGSRTKSVRSQLSKFPLVLASSKFVQQRLLQLVELPLNRSMVAPFGVDPVFGEPQDCIVERPFLLAVGNTSQWKNIDLLMSAYDRIRDETPYNLVILGRPGDAEREVWSDRVFRIDRLPEANVAGLYQASEAFVRTAPSDGTGVTVLEAMAAGALVIAPRSGAIQEMGGNTPLYFNGDSVDSLVGSLKRVSLMPEDERARRAALGRQTAHEYTWERCAMQVLKGLRRVVESA